MHQLLKVYQSILPQPLPDESTFIFMDLLQTYRQAHRHYHTINHLKHFYHVLTHSAEFLSLDGDQRHTILWAMFYHDYVYDPFSTENESQSAEKALQVMTYFKVETAIQSVVRELILATGRHGADFTTDEVTALFLDADLSILGASWETYRQYAENVRKEYAQVPEELFNAGRKKILEAFLAQDQIYRLTAFQQKYEDQARKNIQSELQQLNG